jgi:Protein of unknown function (DUF1194)
MDHRRLAVGRRSRARSLARRFLAGLLWAGLLGLGSSQPAAAVDWLVLVVDRSKSIDDHELALQRNAYIRLLSDADVIAALGAAQVAIVEFDTRAEIVVDWSDPAAAALAYRRKAPDGPRGQTGIGGALTTALALLAGKSGRLVIDVSGDGRDNVDHALLAESRAAATSHAIEVNGLAIVTGETPDIDRYYSGNVVNGFVLSVEQQADFLNALKRKLFYEVAGGWPDPSPPAVRLASEPDPARAGSLPETAVRRIATPPRSAAGRRWRAHGAQR